MTSQNHQSLPPGPTGQELAAMYDQGRDNPLEILRELQLTYGDVVGYTLSAGQVVLINSAAHVDRVLSSDLYKRTDTLKFVAGNGLISADDEQWKVTRRGVARWFGAESMMRFESVIQRAVERVVQSWSRAADSGDEVDIYSDMTGLAFEVITEAMFGHAMTDERQRFSDAVYVAMRYLGRASTMLLGQPMVFDPHAFADMQKAVGFIDQVVGELVDGVDENDADAYLSLVARSLKGYGTPAEIRKRMRDEVVTLLIAGHETTSTALSWTWHLLATHESAATRLRDELHDVLDGRPPCFADRARLTYTRQVLNESMRLYPPVWFIARRATAEDEIGGYAIPEGGTVVVCPYTIHRHPNAWRDADRFDPDRFAEGSDATRPRYSFIPFGAGPHLCLGATFAVNEAILALAGLGQHFCPTPVDGYQPGADPQVTFRPLRLRMTMSYVKRA
ncbi:MAG: cytochrome P450 [Phycisphaera sp.]|nr:cytochrome P450 [Phycisphaera sp.]